MLLFLTQYLSYSRQCDPFIITTRSHAPSLYFPWSSLTVLTERVAVGLRLAAQGSGAVEAGDVVLVMIAELIVPGDGVDDPWRLQRSGQ